MLALTSSVATRGPSDPGANSTWNVQLAPGAIASWVQFSPLSAKSPGLLPPSSPLSIKSDAAPVFVTTTGVAALLVPSAC